MKNKFLKKLKHSILYIRDLPKTIFLNYKCLPKNQARKLPIRIKWNTKIGLLDNQCITIECDNLQRGMIEMGFRGGQFVSENNSYFSVSKGGKIIFKGYAVFAEGFNIFVDGGILTFGNNFYSNRNLLIENEKKIQIGDDVLLGWNVDLRDTDGHTVFWGGEKKQQYGEIIIGNHVWIASDSTILKNSKISNGSIVACESLICGLKLYTDNCLIAGRPAIVKRNNIDWKN